jgi:hypothetical protein
MIFYIYVVMYLNYFIFFNMLYFFYNILFIFFYNINFYSKKSNDIWLHYLITKKSKEKTKDYHEHEHLSFIKIVYTIK